MPIRFVTESIVLVTRGNQMLMGYMRISKSDGSQSTDLQRDALVAAETSASVQALYKRYSDEAVECGVFGAPTYVLDGERFWGQDRLTV